MWTGRILSGLAILFLLMDSIMKLVHPTPPPVTQAMAQLGYPAAETVPIGILLLVCTVLYIIPRTSVLGAVLLTGYLGGAVASKVRIDAPLFSNTLFPVYVALFVWGGLLLRDSRLRSVFPFRR